MLRVSDIEWLVRRAPLMSVVGLVAQVSGRLDALISPGKDLDAQALLIFHRDDLFGCRRSETAESYDFSGWTPRTHSYHVAITTTLTSDWSHPIPRPTSWLPRACTPKSRWAHPGTAGTI